MVLNAQEAKRLLEENMQYGVLIIPAGKYEEIADNAFSKSSSSKLDELRFVVISKGIRKIGHYAFSKCNNLSDVTIENGVELIEDGAFAECLNLARISIPDSIKKIGTNAFKSCITLKRIEIPSKVAKIEKETFFGCTNLKEVTLKGDCGSIGENAFAFCKNLYAFNCKKVFKIKVGAFKHSGTLGFISNTFPEGLIEIEDSAFSNCEIRGMIKFPNSLETIGNNVFYSCKGLTGVEIPNSVNSIGFDVFEKCDNLTTVNVGRDIFYLLINREVNLANSYGKVSVIEYPITFKGSLNAKNISKINIVEKE